MDLSCSVIITAFNEEKTILRAFLDTRKTLIDFKINYEIIIVNDHSQDKTQLIIKKIVSKYSNVKFILNDINYGPGKSFTVGVKKAKGDIVFWLSADVEVVSKEYLKHLKLFKDYDLITFFHRNPRSRGFFRYIISLVYTKILNLFFRTNIEYYNGATAIWRNIYLQTIPKSNRFFFSAECKLKAIKKGYLNIQIPITIEEKKQDRSIRNIITPIRPSNLYDVLISFIKLYWDIYFSNDFKKMKKLTKN